eukprot:Platyproteum_vivax@DN83_c0_g1_i1.p1
MRIQEPLLDAKTKAGVFEANWSHPTFMMGGWGKWGQTAEEKATGFVDMMFESDEFKTALNTATNNGIGIGLSPGLATEERFLAVYFGVDPAAVRRDTPDTAMTPEFTDCATGLNDEVRKVFVKLNALKKTKTPTSTPLVMSKAMLQYSFHHGKNLGVAVGDFETSKKCAPSGKSWATGGHNTCKFTNKDGISCCDDGKSLVQNCVKTLGFPNTDIGTYTGNAILYSITHDHTQVGTASLHDDVKKAVGAMMDSGVAFSKEVNKATYTHVGAWTYKQRTSIVVGDKAGTPCEVRRSRRSLLHSRVLPALASKPPALEDCSSSKDATKLGVAQQLLAVLNEKRTGTDMLLSKQLLQAAYYHAYTRDCTGGSVPDPATAQPCQGSGGWKGPHGYPNGTDFEHRYACCPYSETANGNKCNPSEKMTMFIDAWRGTITEYVAEIGDRSDKALNAAAEAFSLMKDSPLHKPAVKQVGIQVVDMGLTKPAVLIINYGDTTSAGDSAALCPVTSVVTPTTTTTTSGASSLVVATALTIATLTQI